jgi:hypothetical protein
MLYFVNDNWSHNIRTFCGSTFKFPRSADDSSAVFILPGLSSIFVSHAIKTALLCLICIVLVEEFFHAHTLLYLQTLIYKYVNR